MDLDALISLAKKLAEKGELALGPKPTAAAIATLEAAIGRPFPPSYVRFIREVGPFGGTQAADSCTVLVFQNEGLPRMRALQKELAEGNHENADLKRDIGRLKAEVRDLRDNPTAVERIARDQLGLVRKSEVVFQFAKGR